MKYFFVLGNTPDLAREEVKALLDYKELFYDPPLLIIETEDQIPFDRFGGVVKVGEIINEGIIEYLKKSGQKSIDFGVSAYQVEIPDLKEIKLELTKAGIKSRFVLPQRGQTTLSSVVVRKQLLTEFLLFKELIAKTIWSQDFEDWGVRDFGRPAVDPHIGMLPPKVARMMVNIGSSDQVLGSRKFTIFDPFCGVGTILAEALTLGFDVIGSDINPAQIAKAKKNLEWLPRTQNLEPSNFLLLVGDARSIVVPPVDAIVTEPYLGPDDPRKLEQLYLDALSHWQKILKPAGRVVIATPFPIDKEKLMGYSVVAGPFPYFRPQAKVRRNISIFTYGTH